ncbi:N-acetyltransferase [Carnobacterium maltaromaticum]|uniref:GNAT family N-acetyltransferase n=1 Tax=Carnobacterium maltaromaticum TaxID=2751 RepID=UPI000C77F77E|nr:GNAT family N-acetyltransferase [Carnobacterium maltaromaticum]PLS35181.1 N-acetyltransferase [Carnobacterium maltaromaticum]PLS35594.1 N-acetyltransferase [Carnobacterium maltaromaticum]PLS36045.1 N-acetyltransferase [Carnobacterium maltaromaticum]PLS42502.1 N-acetyltransferase [Carnobacterium maltaromaticum]PLS45523.1 N-acetyltransferase [Carnobacterium maltaromaticum]
MIRLATEIDIPAILAIYNQAILKTTATYDEEIHTIDEQLAWFNEKRQNEIPLIVFEEDGIVAGYGTYGPFREKSAFRYTIEHSIYVGEAHQGKGIGEKLLIELIKLAKAADYWVMIGGIDHGNPGSIHLHKKLGFTYCGTLKAVGYKFNQLLDLDYYQLDLRTVG